MPRNQRSNRRPAPGVSWGRVGRLSLIALLFICVPALLAQDQPAPTQPPNTYPPFGHGTIPSPGLPGRKSKKKSDEDLTKFSGVVHELALDHLAIETADHRTVTLHLTKDTNFMDGANAVTLKDVGLGQPVDVDAQETEDEEFNAVTVHLKAQPATVVETVKDDPDEDARPHLKFGKPAATSAKEDVPDEDENARPMVKPGKPASSPAESQTEAANIPPPSEERELAPPMERPRSDAHAEFIEKAREIAFNFTDGLPNYMCQEMVTRYFSDNHAGTLWRPQDVVSESVIWNHNKEEYRNVEIDGKKVNPEKVGDRAWSTGEFGTVLMGLLYPGTQADFHFVRNTTVHHVDAVMYDFTVERPHSHWTIHEGGQSIQPAYSGTIWFEKSSARALRIEFSAEDIPKDFPADTAETALDYDYVLLGEKKFLLPVHSDVLICHRGSSICSKNAIDFRNYHKYGSESEIKFGADEGLAPPLAPSDQPQPKKK